MVEIVNNILWTFQNLFEVLQNDLAQINQDNFLDFIIPSLIGFAMFYFPSRWFKAYLIRLFLFVVGIYFFWNACQWSSILFRLDIYASVGLFLPHIEIVEITYLILRERTLFVYDKLVEFLLFILSPFIWLYQVLLKVFSFIGLKQEQFQEYRAEKQYQKQQQKEEKQRAKEEKQFYENEFKRQQEKAYKEEQAKYDEADKKRQGKKQKYRYKKKEKKQQQNNEYEYQEETHQAEAEEEEKTYSRWDSSNPYEVLGIDENATAGEIKKAYRNLSKIYHPDLTLFDKEENTVIFQKINGAYEVLK